MNRRIGSYTVATIALLTLLTLIGVDDTLHMAKAQFPDDANNSRASSSPLSNAGDNSDRRAVDCDYIREHGVSEMSRHAAFVR